MKISKEWLPSPDLMAMAALGLLIGILWGLPASWADRIVQGSTQGQVRVVNTQGSIWSGSGQVAVGDKAIGPAIDWQLLPSIWPVGLAIELKSPSLSWATEAQGLRLSITGEVSVPAGQLLTQRMGLTMLPPPLGVAKLESINTLKWPALVWSSGKGLRTPTQTNVAAVELRMNELSSRLSPIKPLGNYMVSLSVGPTGAQSWSVKDLDNAVLSVSASGTLTGPAMVAGPIRGELECRRFCDHLTGLMSLIGKKDGDRYVFSHTQAN